MDDMDLYFIRKTHLNLSERILYKMNICKNVTISFKYSDAMFQILCYRENLRKTFHITYF